MGISMSEYNLLPDDAVVNLALAHPLLGRALFKVAEFSEAGTSQINAVNKTPQVHKPDCEVLIPGLDWKKGKYRFRVIVEFCPDEPEG
jgi:hypothetical protein